MRRAALARGPRGCGLPWWGKAVYLLPTMSREQMTQHPTARAIQPDVATLPRKVMAPERANLVGLTREGLRAALIGAGTAEA